MKFTMKQCARRSGLTAVHFLVFMAIPVVCLAFGGKVSYSNGSPAAGAQVNLVAIDVSQKSSNPNPTQTNPILNTDKNTVYPNAGIIAPSKGNLVISPKSNASVKCDASGRFSFPDQSTANVMIQVRAPNGEDFATVTLPAGLFAKGEVSIILQRKY